MAMMRPVSTWAHPNGDAASRPMPACTQARGDHAALYRGVDANRSVRTTPTLASRDAWTVGRGSPTRRFARS